MFVKLGTTAAWCAIAGTTAGCTVAANVVIAVGKSVYGLIKSTATTDKTGQE